MNISENLKADAVIAAINRLTENDMPRLFEKAETIPEVAAFGESFEFDIFSQHYKNKPVSLCLRLKAKGKKSADVKVAEFEFKPYGTNGAFTIAIKLVEPELLVSDPNIKEIDVRGGAPKSSRAKRRKKGRAH